MKDQDIDRIIGQNQGLSGQQQNNGLSNVPYYIQALQRQMDRIEYKLNTLLEQKKD